VAIGERQLAWGGVRTDERCEAGRAQPVVARRGAVHGQLGGAARGRAGARPMWPLLGMRKEMRNKKIENGMWGPYFTIANGLK
jgi:hypothetical protein